MSEKILKQKATGIFILIVIILGFLFYWYEYRPRQIKKECLIEAGKKSIIRGFTEISYKDCLIRKGL